MATPKSFYGETYADNTVKSNGQPETASFSVAVATLSAANYVAKRALIQTLSDKIADIVLGNQVLIDVTIDREITGTGPATTVLAQRENKLLIRYHDTTTHKKFTVSIPTFDLTELPDHSEFLDITTAATPGNDLKVAFEAIVVSPDDDSHAVVMDSAQFVGRNT